MIKCPNCEHDNREGARFCSKCSTALPSRAFVDFYALLNLAPEAASDEVRAALHAAARAQPAPLTPEQLDEAINVLTDARQRADYDQQRLIHLAEQQLKKADLASNDYYRRLGVSRFARRRDIQEAFDRLASLALRGKVSRGGLKRLEEALAGLIDPVRRRVYNQTLDATSGPDDVPIPHEFNYYDYLGLDRSATDTQIRKADEALRGPLTLKAKMGDQGAEATLRQLNQIIQTLTDAGKRAAYDADTLHDVFRFQTPGRLTPTARSARFTVIENIVYGTEGNGLSAFGGPWPDDRR